MIVVSKNPDVHSHIVNKIKPKVKVSFVHFMSGDNRQSSPKTTPRPGMFSVLSIWFTFLDSFKAMGFNFLRLATLFEVV